MKTQILALCLGVATLGTGPISFAPAVAYAQDEVSFEYFQESLSPYGEWIQVGDYGLCWQPAGVSEDWAPYTDGYWSYTDAGWTWVSYEDFGGITYHYGRWVSVEDTGWCWVPDYDWGPAWVSWRNSDEHVGWAPLPPEATWDASIGIGINVDNSYDIGPEYYNFCDVADFGSPVIREVLIPRPRNEIIIINTVNITNITVNTGYSDGYWNGGVPFCGGPRYDFISRHVRRPIPALKLVRETNITNIYNNTVVNNNTTIINQGGGRGRGRAVQAVQRGNQLIVPAPRIRRMDNPMAQLKIKPQRVIAKENVRVNKGWKMAEKAGKREEIRERMNRGTADLPRGQRAKAKPIQASDLAVVPTKGDANAPAPGANGRNRRDRAQQEREGGPKRDDATVKMPDTSEPGREGRGRNGEKAEDAVAGRSGRGEGRGQQEKPEAAIVAEPAREGRGRNGDKAEDAVVGRPGRGEGRGQQEKPEATAATEPAQVTPGENGNGKRNRKDDVVAERGGKAKDAAAAARSEAMERKDSDSRAESRKALQEQQQAEQSRKKERQTAEAAEQRSKLMERHAERQRETADDNAQPKRKQAQAEDSDRGSAVRERAAAQAAAREKAQAQSNAAERQRESSEAANRVRRQQAAQAEAGEQRRKAAMIERQQPVRQQQQAERPQAARQQQVQQAQRNQAARQEQQQQVQRQQMQQRAVQAQRQQQQQPRPQQQRPQQQAQRPQQQQVRQQPRPQVQQPQRQQGGGGGGGGRGQKNLTAEELKARRGQ